MYHSLLVQLKNCQIISFMKEFMYSCMEGQNDSMDQSKLQQYYDKIMDQNLNDDDCNRGAISRRTAYCYQSFYKRRFQKQS